MADLDPVPWDAIEAATGPPATEIVEAVDRLEDDLPTDDPYAAVKAVHDALADEAVDRSVPGLGDPFVTAYLLEQRGVIDPAEAPPAYTPMAARRPTDERLRELFWDREYTLWWIGTIVGVHASLVTYWLWEADVPLMERNLSAETLAAVEAAREDGTG